MVYGLEWAIFAVSVLCFVINAIYMSLLYRLWRCVRTVENALLLMENLSSPEVWEQANLCADIIGKELSSPMFRVFGGYSRRIAELEARLRVIQSRLCALSQPKIGVV